MVALVTGERSQAMAGTMTCKFRSTSAPSSSSGRYSGYVLAGQLSENLAPPRVAEGGQAERIRDRTVAGASPESMVS
jgi:hypothetical protein